MRDRTENGMVLAADIELHSREQPATDHPCEECGSDDRETQAYARHAGLYYCERCIGKVDRDSVDDLAEAADEWYTRGERAVGAVKQVAAAKAAVGAALLRLDVDGLAMVPTFGVRAVLEDVRRALTR